jgi:hypothetical protein
MSKSVRVGTIFRGKKGPFLVLGNDRSKDPKYNYTVEFRVKDAAGNIVTKGQNPLISMFIPKTENKAISHELVLFVEEND